MKIRFCFTLVLLMVAATAMSQDQPIAIPPDPLRPLGNGVWWARLNPEAKNNFVDGYTTAMAKVNRTTHAFCMDSKSKVTPDTVNAAMGGILQMCGLAQLFDYGVDATKLQGEIDGFYGDPQNTLIPIELAMQYVRDKLKGDTSPNELQKQLNEWRQIVNKKN